MNNLYLYVFSFTVIPLRSVSLPLLPVYCVISVITLRNQSSLGHSNSTK